MPKISLSKKLLAGAVVGAALWTARRIAYAPPNTAVEARAHDATRSGPWRHNYATVNGVRLHYAEVGSGPLVILLHGFPQCWYEWRYVIPRLAEHFHVIAPDMRGYNESDKPPGIASYTIENLTQDIASLIETLGEERAHIVGHDWGGGVAWGLGMQHSHRVDRLAVLNSPHPAAFERELKKGRQLLRSWYIFFFQLPLLPEASMRLTLRRSLPNSAQVPGAFPEEALDVYENAISQPGAATAMINYYRALFRNAPAARRLIRPITRPTLLLWGMKDFALIPELTEGLEQWVPDLRIERREESGHWLPEEKPGVVGDALLDFLLN
jgi:pimeloyl-ACP methyl ester carboxylesterase